MRKIDTFNLRWYAAEIDKEIQKLNEEIVIPHLYKHPMHLEIQELYVLREALVRILVDSEALQTEVAKLRSELKVPLWKRLLSK